MNHQDGQSSYTTYTSYKRCSQHFTGETRFVIVQQTLPRRPAWRHAEWQ